VVQRLPAAPGGVDGNETTGGLAAAPVAKAVMEAYLKSGAGQ